MKHIYIICSALCLCMVSTTMAQKPTDKKVLSELNTVLEKLDYYTTETDSMRKSYLPEDSLTVDKLYNNFFQEKQKVHDFKHSLVSLNDEIGKIMHKLEILNITVEQLKPFQEIKTNNIYAKNKEYLSLPFSKISKEQLNHLKDSLSYFETKNDFEDYKLSIETTTNNLNLYKRALSALENKYDHNLNEGLKKSLDSLQKSKSLSSYQQKELENDSVLIKLKRYKYGIKYFKQLIVEINNNDANVSTIKNVYYNTPQKNFNNLSIYQFLFAINPYLKDMWDKYFKGFGTSRQKELEEEINEIKTDLS